MSPTMQYTPEYLAEDISAKLLATCITFLVLETVFMVLLWTSRYCAKGERPNKAMEIFMTLTYLVCCGKITVVLLLIKIGGSGHHTVALSPATMANALKLSTASQIVCPMTTSLSKLGVLCLFQRILGHVGRSYRIVIRATFVVVLMTMIAQVLIPFINCRPFSKTWNPKEPGTCAIPSLSLWRYLGIPNVFTTLVVVSIPVPAMAKLHVSRPVKCGLMVVFAVCIAGVVAAFMRFYSFLKVTDFHDITYENVNPMCWIVAESGIYLVAGVMLTLRPLLRTIFKDTALERFITRGSRTSGSWGSQRTGPRWHWRIQQVARPTHAERQSVPDVTVESKAHATDGSIRSVYV